MADKLKSEKKNESWGLVQMDKAAKVHYRQIKNKYLINNPRLWKNDWKK